MNSGDKSPISEPDLELETSDATSISDNELDYRAESANHDEPGLSNSTSASLAADTLDPRGQDNSKTPAPRYSLTHISPESSPDLYDAPTPNPDTLLLSDAMIMPTDDLEPFSPEDPRIPGSGLLLQPQRDSAPSPSMTPGHSISAGPSAKHNDIATHGLLTSESGNVRLQDAQAQSKTEFPGQCALRPAACACGLDCKNFPTVLASTALRESGRCSEPPPFASPDPSHWSYIYHGMAHLLGPENILLPPPQLSDPEKALWLKSDSNSVLYYYYKLPKYRKAIETQLERSQCSHLCGDQDGNCDWTVAKEVWYWALFPCGWCIGASSAAKSIETFVGDHRDAGTLLVGSHESMQLYHGTVDGDLVSDLVKQSHVLPLSDSLLVPQTSLFSCGKLSWCLCYQCSARGYRHTMSAYMDKRYGRICEEQFVYHRYGNRKDKSKSIPTALRQYWTQCQDHHNVYPSQGVIASGKNKWRHRNREYVGGRANQVFAELDQDKLPQVLEYHNEKWGRIGHTVDINKMKISLIFDPDREVCSGGLPVGYIDEEDDEPLNNSFITID